MSFVEGSDLDKPMPVVLSSGRNTEAEKSTYSYTKMATTKTKSFVDKENVRRKSPFRLKMDVDNTKKDVQ